MKLARFEITKKSESLIIIKFLDYNYNNPYINNGFLIDFKNKKVSKETSWHNSFINKDKFTITFDCGVESLYIDEQIRAVAGSNQLLRIPKVILNKEYELEINIGYNADILIKQIIDVFSILSKRK